MCLFALEFSVVFTLLVTWLLFPLFLFFFFLFFFFICLGFVQWMQGCIWLCDLSLVASSYLVFAQFGYGFTYANTRYLAVVCYQNFGSITAL